MSTHHAEDEIKRESAMTQAVLNQLDLWPVIPLCYERKAQRLLT
jgi:hypothetical protein